MSEPQEPHQLALVKKEGGRSEQKAGPLALKREHRILINPNLAAMPPIPRTAEVLRYSALRLERWISPDGILRQWVRLNLWFAVMILIPAVVVAPIAAMLMSQVETITALLLQSLTNLLYTLMTAVAIMGILSGIWTVVKMKMASSSGGRRRR